MKNRVVSLLIALMLTLFVPAISYAVGGEIVFAVTETNGGANNLITFSSSNPGVILKSVPISGFGSDEKFIGLDYRPCVGREAEGLYAVTRSNDSLKILLYSLGLDGIATHVSESHYDFPPFPSGKISVDFDPSNEQITITNPAGNFHRKISFGGAAGAPDGFYYDDSDINHLLPLNIQGVAFSNNLPLSLAPPGTTLSRSLYVVDGNANALLRTDIDAADTGLLHTVGSLGVSNLTAINGFEIISHNGDTGFAALETSDHQGSYLYSVDLSSGAASSLGPIGTIDAVKDITVALRGKFDLSDVSYLVDEGAGAINVTVLRTGSSTTDVALKYSTSDGSAVSGRDYEGTTTGEVVFLKNKTSAVISVPIKDNNKVDGDRVFNLTLNSADNGGVIGAASSASIKIHDNEVSANGVPTGGGLNSGVTVRSTAIKKLSVKTLIRKGFKSQLLCSADCTAVLTLHTIGRKTVIIGTVKNSFLGGVSTKISFKLSSRIKKRLSSYKRLPKALLNIVAAGQLGGVTSLDQSIRLVK